MEADERRCHIFLRVVSAAKIAVVVVVVVGAGPTSAVAECHLLLSDSIESLEDDCVFVDACSESVVSSDSLAATVTMALAED